MTIYLGTNIVANSVTVPYNWSGTKAEYDAITTKNPEWVYYITDDSDITLSLLQTIYPVGSIYITTNSTCPLAALFGTWTLVAADRVLQGAGTRGSVGDTLAESLPNITGTIRGGATSYGSLVKGDTTGALRTKSTGWNGLSAQSVASVGDKGSVTFNASDSSSIYQDNAHVQPDAYLVNIYRRTA